jgi:hypothetical protein
MTTQRVRGIVAVAAILVVLLAVIFVPVGIPVNYSAFGIALPSREWNLSYAQDDQIASVFHNNVNGTIDRVQTSTFERGDRVEIRLRPEITPGTRVRTGDTIATVQSRTAVTNWTLARRDLAAEHADLIARASRVREGDIEAARLEVTKQQERLSFARQNAERIQSLVEHGMAAQSELDVAESRLRDLLIERDQARAELNAIQSAVSQEEFEWRQRRLNVAEQVAELAAEQAGDSVIVAPFAGRIVGVNDSTTIVALRDTGRNVIRFPVSFSRRNEVSPGMRLSVKLPDDRSTVSATVVRVDESVHVLNGRQDMVATALTDLGESLPAGLVVNCKIQTGSLRPLPYLIRFLSSP